MNEGAIRVDIPCCRSKSHLGVLPTHRAPIETDEIPIGIQVGQKCNRGAIGDPAIDMRTLAMLVDVVVANRLDGAPSPKLVLVVHHNWGMSLGKVERRLEGELEI